MSDTALLVAACRALETELPDGFVRDPFAGRLAGERGKAIATSVPQVGLMQLGVGLRSHFMDELLGVAMGDGVDTVLNLGAGLDTRPWRLDLPADLRWIEVDFPAMLDYKAAALAGAEPRCRLERMSADLTIPAERATVLDRVAGARTLLITEGLLMYLPAETVRALAAETRANPAFLLWMLDGSSIDLLRAAHGDLVENINRVRDETHLNGGEVRDVVEAAGWVPLQRRTYATEGRAMSLPRIPKILESLGGRIDPSAGPPADDGSGVWLYHKP